MPESIRIFQTRQEINQNLYGCRATMRDRYFRLTRENPQEKSTPLRELRQETPAGVKKLGRNNALVWYATTLTEKQIIKKRFFI